MSNCNIHNKNKNDINVCFLITSCQKYSNKWPLILRRMKASFVKYYFIIVGDPSISSDYIVNNGHILRLRCRDTYEALPEKIAMSLYALSKMNIYSNITHTLKIDDDNLFRNTIYPELIQCISNNINSHYLACSIN